MSLATIGVNQTETINQNEIDSIAVLSLQTLGVPGMSGSPTDKALSRVDGVGILNTINLTGADGSLAGLRDVNALLNYNEISYGAHFFATRQNEVDDVRNSGTPNYRADLFDEPDSSFAEHSSPQAGNVSAYRFFDRKLGTHFYPGRQTKAAAIAVPGAAYQPERMIADFGFFAPSNSYL